MVLTDVNRNSLFLSNGNFILKWCINLSFLNICKAWWDKDLLWVPANVGLLRYGDCFVETRADYYSYILNQLRSGDDAYFPFYTPMVSKFWPQEQKDAVVMTRLFLDIDKRKDDRMADIWEKARFFATRFWNNMDLFFSSGKGFHFYLYLNPATYGEMHKERETLYWNLSTWLQYLNDKRAFLSLDRVCRITLTKHSIDPDDPSPTQWKVPISPDMSFDDIIKRSQSPHLYIKEMTELYQRKPIPLDWKIFLESPDRILTHNI